jgi:hypothetical protein
LFFGNPKMSVVQFSNDGIIDLISLLRILEFWLFLGVLRFTVPLIFVHMRVWRCWQGLALVGGSRWWTTFPPPPPVLCMFSCVFQVTGFMSEMPVHMGRWRRRPAAQRRHTSRGGEGGGVCREKKQNRKATLFMHGPSARPPYPPCVRARYILHPHHSPALCGWRSNNDRKYSESRNTRVCLVGARGQRNNLNAE